MMDQTFHQVGPTLEGVDWQYPLKIWFSARVIRPASSHVTCHMLGWVVMKLVKQAQTETDKLDPRNRRKQFK